jgi:S-adenosylmethionine:tRNA ribosyltransferase-isomerase
MQKLSDYEYSLPVELIATKALLDRSTSRLLCLLKNDEKARHDQFKNIGHYLKPGDVLVVNNTKVMKTRIFAVKKSGGKVELLILRRLKNKRYEALIKGKGPFLPGTSIFLSSNSKEEIIITEKSLHKPGLYQLACLLDLMEYAKVHGNLPLPPYFQRNAMKDDDKNYQTIFAKELGAVAAPTAGLHFTKPLLNNLKEQGIEIVETTLHVGPGTFLSIRNENIAEHKMHSEHIRMDASCAHVLNQAKNRKSRIIAVGTTSMRVIEQVKHWAHEKNSDDFFACEGETSLFIRPGYKFLGCHGIITNFHLPRSTLLLLVCAVAQKGRILKAYQEAIERKYRFFSYGDACFFEIWNQ